MFLEKLAYCFFKLRRTKPLESLRHIYSKNGPTLCSQNKYTSCRNSQGEVHSLVDLFETGEKDESVERIKEETSTGNWD